MSQINSFISQAITKDINWQCGIYLRLSREDGDKMESDSITNQRKIIDRYLEKNPELNIFDVYTDDGFSGTNFDRPNVTRLLEDIKSQKVNCLIIKDLSRFGRNYHEVGRYIEVVFPILKLRFISINDYIDSHKNPSSLRNASVSFKNVMNDEYCRDISNKIRSSFNMKRKRGDFIGSFASYGYLKDPINRHRLIIDKDAAENVKQIFQWFLDGMSIHNICRLLFKLKIPNPTEYKMSNGLALNRKSLESTNGAWSNRTIQRMLKNRLYVGDLIQKRYERVSYKVPILRIVPEEQMIVRKNNHEPIIDIETFDKVQELFKYIRWQSQAKDVDIVVLEKNNMLNIFAGYVKCADCKRAMTRNKVTPKNGKEYYYFSCTSYRKWRQCSKHTIQVEKVEKAVLTVLQKQIDVAIEMEGFLQIISKAPYHNNAQVRLKKSIELQEAGKVKIINFLNDLYPDFKNGLITKEQYLKFKNDNEAKIAEINSILVKLNEQLIKDNEQMDNTNSYIANFKKYKNLTSLNREVIIELIKSININENGGIEIELNFMDSYERALEYVQSNQNILNENGLEQALVI